MLNQRQPGWRVWAIILALTAAVAAPGIRDLRWYRDWRFSHLPLAALERDVAHHSNDPVYLYYLGRQLNARQQFPVADPILRHAVGLDPDSARLRDEWARALLGSGLTTAAFGELRQFAGTHPDSAQASFILGKFYFTENATDRASEELERSVALDGSNGEAWAYLAASDDEQGDDVRAMAAIQRAARLRPDDGGIHLSYAMMLARTNSGRARQEYARAAALLPHTAAAHREYANWLLVSGAAETDRRVAEVEARRAVALDEKDSASQLTLGRVLRQSGDTRAALGPLTRAALLAPDDPVSAHELETAYRALGDQAGAARWQASYEIRQRYFSEVTSLTARIRVSPTPDDERKLARLLGAHGDVAGCIRHYAQALHCAPDAPPALVLAADTLVDGGYASAALPLARRAAALSKGSPTAHEALGNALLGTGNVTAALAEYQQVVGWQPDHAAAIRARLERYYVQQAAHPGPAELAYQQATHLQASTVGPVTATNGIESLAKRAVDLEPTNPRYLEYLISVQMARRETAAAAATARRLLTVAPHDARGHAMLAVLTCETAVTPKDLSAVEAHIKAAAGDPSVAATLHYASGCVALLRRQPARAIEELRQAIKLDPRAETAYYKLAQAEGMAGHTAESAAVMAEFNRRYNAKSAEWKALQDIHQNPNKEGLYERAAKLFDAHGLSAQAEAIRSAARRRFESRTVSREPGLNPSRRT